MIRILVEGMTEGKGGKEAYLINMYRAFNKDLFSFSFIMYDKTIAYREELEATGAQLLRLPARSEGLFKYRKQLEKLFSENKYDVLWANKTTLSSCEIIEIAKKHNVPVRIVHSHSSDNMGGKLTFLLHNINKRLVQRWANMFYACSKPAGEWFFGERPYILVNNGIDTEKFRFDSRIRKRVRDELRLGDGFTIGHVGRFGIEKNHKKLINVFYAVHKIRPDAKLLLCGDGEERANIEKQISDLNLQDSVLLLGIIDNVNEVLQALDVFVMTSLFEGLPFALLEAQAAGLKCIVSDSVSAESDVMGWNDFVPLSADDCEWAERILKQKTDLNERINAASIMKSKGFDIYECVEQVEDEIIKALKDNQNVADTRKGVQ